MEAQGMKILVGGGAGFIGSLLVPVLLEHGYEVTVADLCWFGNNLPTEVEVHKKDLFQLTPNDMEGYEQVIFLAGLSNDPMAEFDPARNFVFNGALPSYLGFAAKQAGVSRLIYASSCSVYGYTMNELYDEESPVTSTAPYGISKLQGERGVLQLKDDTFSVIALRQGTVCGYSPRMRFDLIVNAMFKTAMTERVINVNNPAIWRPILDIRDATTAYLRAIQADYSISGVFNVASGNYTVGQVADLVRDSLTEMLGTKIRLNINSIKDFRNYKVTWEKARTVLGFRPKYEIDDIVKDLYAHRELFQDYTANEYYNIATFKLIEQDWGKFR
jgi:nucleoside-diphosphate-sugar epimerase